MSRRESTVRQQLRTARAPLEAQAEERAWRAVRAVYADREPRVARRRLNRLTLIPAVLGIAGVLALTPAGAAVHRWIDRTLGVKHARPALFSLPGRGEILVAGGGGAWTVSADGSKRRLGPFSQVTWSPHAIYVAGAARDQLVAMTAQGTPRWSIARPDVRLPQWFAPNGFRVAYLSGQSLRVIAGDGTGDHLLASRVASVAPAWQPGHPYRLAYVGADGSVFVRDADNAGLAWSHRLAGPRPDLLRWSAEGARLLVLSRARAVVLDSAGDRLRSVSAPAGETFRDGAFSPDGRRLALLTGTQVTITTASSAGQSQRIFSGAGLRQLAFSPDGKWLLVAWPAADQWVFIRLGTRPRITAVSRIAEQFSGSARAAGFPALEGWCCTSRGG
jgi:hypothetical protein